MNAVVVALALASGTALTEEQAVELAVAHSPALAAKALELEQAKAGVDVAARLSNPELRLSNLRSDRLLSPLFADDGSRPNVDRVSLGLKWWPPNPWTRPAERVRAEREADEADAELDEARRALVGQVRSLHATVLGLDAQLALARRAVDTRAELRDLVRRRLEQHAATALEQGLADLDHLDALAAVQELESKRREAFHDLLALLGPGADGVDTLAGGAHACEPPPSDPAPLYEKARASSPRLRALRARLAAAEAERERLDRAVLPWLDSFTLAWVAGRGTDPSFASFRLEAPLPLLDRNGPELQVASLRRARLEEESRVEDAALTRRIRRVLDEQASQAELVRRYREAEPLVDDTVGRLAAAVEAAQADLVQVALVQTRILSARRAHLRATLDCRLSAIELDRLVGP